MCKAAYIHVPFCRDICAYCDFFRCRYHAGLADRWLEVIEQELHEKLHAPLDTLYIGGGTPSALSYAQLEHVLKQLDPYEKGHREYTMEANVESLSSEILQLCVRHGVDRISLGVQSLQPQLLETMHRNHRRDDVLDCIQRIHEAGIHNISIDLIYGLPGQTMAQWKNDLQDVLENFSITHISLYALTIEPHSEFGRKGIQAIDSETEADMYEYAIQVLEQHGFHQYEISNFAKTGYASIHNQYYWRYEDFYGIGCGASGKQQHQRYDNTHNLEIYFQQGPSPVITSLTTEDEMFEMLMMSLRMKEGLDLTAFYERFQVSILDVYKEIIEAKVTEGMLKLDSHHLCASEKGYPLLHEILIAFLP